MTTTVPTATIRSSRTIDHLEICADKDARDAIMRASCIEDLDEALQWFGMQLWRQLEDSIYRTAAPEVHFSLGAPGDIRRHNLQVTIYVVYPDGPSAEEVQRIAELQIRALLDRADEQLKIMVQEKNS